MYDIQTYTDLKLNDNVSSTEVIKSAFIVGKESGANGFTVSAGAGSSTIQITQVSGNFRPGEKILINGVEELSRSVESVKSYGINDVFSFAQSGNETSTANKKINDRIPPRLGTGEVTIDLSGSTATVTAPRIDSFQRFKPGDIIRYTDNKSGTQTQFQNVVLTIAADLQSMTVGTMTTVSNLYDGRVLILQVLSRLRHRTHLQRMHL